MLEHRLKKRRRQIHHPAMLADEQQGSHLTEGINLQDLHNTQNASLGTPDSLGRLGQSRGLMSTLIDIFKFILGLSDSAVKYFNNIVKRVVANIQAVATIVQTVAETTRMSADAVSVVVSVGKPLMSL